jgi:protocatechuate 3,4-dioxygenase alpha subunit
MSLPPTPSQTAGPFFSFGLCIAPQNEVVAGGDVHVAGRILDGNRDPVADAMVEIWQADPDGEYRPDFGWGRCGSDGEGRFSFVTVKPGRVDGQAPHLTVLVFARGLLKPVLTRMYFPDEAAANEADPVLSAVPADDRATLVARPDGDGLRFDVRLQGDGQTAFFTL